MLSSKKYFCLPLPQMWVLHTCQVVLFARADLGSLVRLKFLFGFFNQGFSFLLVSYWSQFFICLLPVAVLWLQLHQNINHTKFTLLLLSLSANPNMSTFCCKKPLLFGLLDGRGESRIRSSPSERLALTPPQNNPIDLKPRGTTKRSKKNVRVINSGLRVEGKGSHLETLLIQSVTKMMPSDRSRCSTVFVKIS